MKKLLQRYMQHWQIGLAAALSVIAIVLAVTAVTTQRDGTLDPAVEASILSSGRAALSGGAPDSAAGPVAVFIGDDYTAGAGSTAPANRWTSVVAARLGWTEVNLGFAGTGYLKGDPARGSYIESIPDVVAANPAIVIISGGRHDVGEPQAEAKLAMTAFLNELRAALPAPKIVVVSPVWDDDPRPADLTVLATDLLAAAAATSGMGYLDIGQPLVGRADLVSDGIHPNDAGHLALADATVAALTAAGITG